MIPTYGGAGGGVACPLARRPAHATAAPACHCPAGAALRLTLPLGTWWEYLPLLCASSLPLVPASCHPSPSLLSGRRQCLHILFNLATTAAHYRCHPSPAPCPLTYLTDSRFSVRLYPYSVWVLPPQYGWHWPGYDHLPFSIGRPPSLAFLPYAVRP